MTHAIATTHGTRLQGVKASLLRLSLEVASKQFREDARVAREAGGAYERLALQFDDQARQADELLLYFCEGDVLTIEFIG